MYRIIVTEAELWHLIMALWAYCRTSREIRTSVSAKFCGEMSPFQCGINSFVVQHSQLLQCAVSKYFCSLKADFCWEEATVNVCNLFV